MAWFSINRFGAANIYFNHSCINSLQNGTRQPRVISTIPPFPFCRLPRPLIVVCNRVDTASDVAVAQWKKYLVAEGGLRADNRRGNVPVFFVDSKRGRGVHEVRSPVRCVRVLLVRHCVKGKRCGRCPRGVCGGRLPLTSVLLK